MEKTIITRVSENDTYALIDPAGEINLYWYPNFDDEVAELVARFRYSIEYSIEGEKSVLRRLDNPPERSAPTFFAERIRKPGRHWKVYPVDPKDPASRYLADDLSESFRRKKFTNDTPETLFQIVAEIDETELV